MFPKLRQSNLLVHITFYYIKERIQYLKQVLAAIYQYPFRQIEIVIDTNTKDFELSELVQPPSNINLKKQIHNNLEHSFLLTWQHRYQMEPRIDKFDYFMYIEDDIVVSAEVIKCWHKESIRLYPLGYLSGFLRIETNANNIIVSTDQYKKTSLKDIVNINGRYYYRPPNPYHGFWIYSQNQMKDFINSPCWKDGNYKNWGIRERAAAGMMWIKNTKHITLIPLSCLLKVQNDVLVYHTPNNYALDAESQYGKLSIATLTKLPFGDWFRFFIGIGNGKSGKNSCSQ